LRRGPTGIRIRRPLQNPLQIQAERRAQKMRRVLVRLHDSRVGWRDVDQRPGQIAPDRNQRRLKMKTIASALVALSLFTGIAAAFAPANADLAQQLYRDNRFGNH
jgi:hypothetical protein